MKKISVLVLTMLWGLGLYAQEDGRLTQEEKSEIAQYMTDAWDKLEASLTGLTAAQWSYKSADTVWSIAEIAEHMEKSEMELYNLLDQQLLTSEAAPDKSSEVATKTHMVMETIKSRDKKFKTRPNLEPEGKYKSPQEFLQNFKDLRDRTLDYAQNSEDALRHHFVPFGPLGDLDGYQIIMFMTGHLERHHQQIEEVKNNPGFPPA